MDLFDLFARIFLDSSEYDKGLGESEKKTESFGSKIKKGLTSSLKVGAAAVTAVTGAALAFGGAMLKATGDVAQYGDNVDKMSQKLGFSVESFQTWDYVLGQAGVDINSMSTGMKTLTNKLDDAKNGGSDAQEMFAKLGLSMEDLASMSREEVFDATIKGFQGMADSTERAALANDLFGRSGQELTPLFNSSIEETEALKDAAHELGFVMGDEAVKASADYQDALDTLKRSFGGLKQRMMGDFMPSITSVMEGLASVFAGDESGTAKLSQGIEGFIQRLSAAAPQIVSVGGTIVTTLLDSITKNLPQLLKVGFDALVTIANGIIENLPAIVSAAVDVIKMIATVLLEPDNVSMLIDAAFDILMALADGMIDALPLIIDATINIIIKLCEKLSDPDTITRLLDAAWQIIKAIATGIVQNIPALLTAIGQALAGILSAIGSKLREFGAKGREILQKIAEGIKNAISSVVNVGLDIVRGIWQGISNGLGWIKDKITGWVGDLLGFFKRLLKIGSPSKVFADEVGRYMAEGVGLGFTKAMPGIEKEMQDAMPTLNGFLDDEYHLSASGYPAYGATFGGSEGTGAEIVAVLKDILDAIPDRIWWDDGTIAAKIDKRLGIRAMQKARGTI